MDTSLPAARFGARFAAVVAPEGESWVRASDLFGDGLDAALSRVAQGRRVPHPAVAGALLMDQYAQRLMPPVVASWFEDGRVLDTRMTRVRLEWDDGSRLARVGFPDPGVAAGGEDLLAERTFASNLDRAVDAVHHATRAGRRVLYGAVAHAVTVAFLALSWSRPDPSHYLGPAGAFLARHGLADLVTVDAREVSGKRWLYAERRSCCLAFRVHSETGTAHGYCATCPVTPEADRHGSFVGAASTYDERHGRERA